MTVARVREVGPDAEAMFFESARVYRLLGASPAYGQTLQVLQRAAASGAPVRVRLATANGDLIESAAPGR